MTKIGIFFAPNSQRSRLVAHSMASGMNRLGEKFTLRSSHLVRNPERYDVAIFYGLSQGLRRIFEEHKRRGKAIYIDLGYWGRRKRSRYDGYHKLALNSRHPTAYFQARPHGPERFKVHDIPIKRWRKSGKHIIVAGMSAKAAAAEGFQPNQWERRTIADLQRLTDRPIIYRPKPNWREARPLPGSEFGINQSLEEALRNCHAVVTHHSNVAVDALLAGVPCICPQGAASVLSGTELMEIENPPMPDGREQWAYDLAWTQWSIAEMKEGMAFRYLRDEGLI